MKNLPIYQLFTDGACSGNPGPGGYGFVWVNPAGKATEGGGYDPRTTNNAMELTAILCGMRQRPPEAKNIVLYSDSKYAIDGLQKNLKTWVKQGYTIASGEPLKNELLWADIYQEIVLAKDFAIEFKWIKGHAGIPLQERTDEIARSFSLSGGDTPKGLILKRDYSVCDDDPVGKSEVGTFKNYYLVLDQNKIARYETWEECKTAVHGVSSVKYQKIKNPDEEISVLKKWGYTKNE